MVRPVMQCVGLDSAVMMKIAAAFDVADNGELWMTVMDVIIAAVMVMTAV